MDTEILINKHMHAKREARHAKAKQKQIWGACQQQPRNEGSRPWGGRPAERFWGAEVSTQAPRTGGPVTAAVPSSSSEEQQEQKQQQQQQGVMGRAGHGHVTSCLQAKTCPSGPLCTTGSAHPPPASLAFLKCCPNL
jgi:hypothetical protein